MTATPAPQAARSATTKDASLQTRLMWATATRLVVTTLLLGSTAFFYLRGNLARYPSSLKVVFGTITIAYAVSAGEATLLRARKGLVALTYGHLTIDQLLWTAIVYVTGGASSGATSFYGLTVLVGAVLVGLRGASFAAAVGFAMYALLCVGFVTHGVTPPIDQPETTYATTMHAIGFPLLLNGLAIAVVSGLAGYLSERLRATGGALEIAQRRYTEAERLAELGRIAAWLAHEIRNPLGSISGSVEMLRDVSALTTEDKKLFDIVSREVSRLNDLVSDMLDLSKARPPEVEAVDIAAGARDIVELARRSPAVEDRRVEYEGPDGPLVVRCDGGQMRQVLWNLVRNALQATPAGSSVRVRARVRSERLVELSVEDEGPGIDDAAKRRIFDAFYTTRSHGAGIGLAVVKRIVDDHAPFGASISVESGASGGARFSLTLQRAKGTASDNPSRAPDHGER